MPRSAVQIDGSVSVAYPPSSTSATSAGPVSSPTQSTIECPPISSSASIAKRTLTGSSPAAARSSVAGEA